MKYLVLTLNLHHSPHTNISNVNVILPLPPPVTSYRIFKSSSPSHTHWSQGWRRHNSFEIVPHHNNDIWPVYRNPSVLRFSSYVTRTDESTEIIEKFVYEDRRVCAYARPLCQCYFTWSRVNGRQMTPWQLNVNTDWGVGPAINIRMWWNLPPRPQHQETLRCEESHHSWMVGIESMRAGVLISEINFGSNLILKTIHTRSHDTFQQTAKY